MVKLTNNPIIKWTGSKRSQAKLIVSNFPKNIKTYYEPFIGSGAVLKELLNNVYLGNNNCNMFICSDINEDLILTWLMIKHEPDILFNYYSQQYYIFKDLDIDGKKQFYNNIKKLYNEYNTSEKKNDNLKYCMFFWLRRTAYNGMVRYNSKGEFNAPCHFTRNGIEPTKLKNILDEWTMLLNKFDVQFLTRDYSLISHIDQNDFIYLDPPYENTGDLYLKNTFNINDFFTWVSSLPAFALSYNGDNKNEKILIPKNLYNEHIYLNSGLSSFSKFKNKNVKINESLYLKS